MSRLAADLWHHACQHVLALPGADGLRKAVAQRGEPCNDIDQTWCTLDTAIRRVLFLAQDVGVSGKTIAFLGDGDLTSLCLLHLQRNGWPGMADMRLLVVDLDQRVLDVIAQHNPGGSIRLIRHDLRQTSPSDLLHAADVVCTDPPYRLSGAELFLSRAVEMLPLGAGGDIVLHFERRSPDETVLLGRLLCSLGLAVHQTQDAFSRYERDGRRDYSARLWWLKTSSMRRPTVCSDHIEPIYNHGLQPTGRLYRCGCGRASVISFDDTLKVECLACREHLKYIQRLRW